MKNPGKLFLILAGVLFSTGLTAQTFTNYTTADGLPDDYIYGGVAVDGNNHIWVGTVAGVAVFDGSNWDAYTMADGLTDDYINCIAVDENDNVWVGTNSGVSKYNGVSWVNYSTADGLVDNAVYAIAGDIDGSVWFGTLAGVSHFDGTTWTTYSTSVGGFPSDLISCIHIDALGNKWFGTWMGGLIKFDGTNYDVITTADGLADDNVTCIATDPAGNVLAGTLYGISRFNSSLVWTDSMTVYNGLYNDYVMDIDIESDGTIWVAMFIDYLLDGGISRYNGSWASWTTTDGLADDLIRKMAIDHDGNVWIATGTGVSRFTDETSAGDVYRPSLSGIYPNPSDGIVNIDVDFSSYEAVVTDLTGRRLFAGSNLKTIDLSDCSEGYYCLTITGQDGSVINQKICIAK